MRILYLSLSYIPSRRASSVQVMRMCAALARQGHEVTLVGKRNPARQEAGVEDVFAFYGVEPRFELVPVARPSFKGGGLAYLWGMHRLLADRRPDLAYCRDPAGAWLAARIGLPLVFEAHGPPRGPLSRAMMRRVMGARGLRRVVFISAALEELFAARGLLPGSAPSVVAPDAADAPPGGAPPPGRPAGRPRVGYVGHLYAGRGIELIVELAGRLPAVEFHLYGGRDSDLERWRSLPPPANVVFHGFVEPAALSAIYGELDVLLMPYQAGARTALGETDTSSWMSPMKMFEYLAAGRPIISSDLPVLREVLADERNALLVPPQDAAAWEAALRRLLDDPALAERLGEQARADLVARYTWDARAERVLDGL